MAIRLSGNFSLFIDGRELPIIGELQMPTIDTSGPTILTAPQMAATFPAQIGPAWIGLALAMRYRLEMLAVMQRAKFLLPPPGVRNA